MAAWQLGWAVAILPFSPQGQERWLINLALKIVFVRSGKDTSVCLGAAAFNLAGECGIIRGMVSYHGSNVGVRVPQLMPFIREECV